jgi:hypothetical protein
MAVTESDRAFLSCAEDIARLERLPGRVGLSIIYRILIWIARRTPPPKTDHALRDDVYIMF